MAFARLDASAADEFRHAHLEGIRQVAEKYDMFSDASLHETMRIFMAKRGSPLVEPMPINYKTTNKWCRQG